MSSNRVAVYNSLSNGGISNRTAGGGSVVVVGSCFMDYIAYVDRMPAPGETLHSNQFQKGFGGKGANQAVMTAKLAAGKKSTGPVVKMVSALGGKGDADAEAYINNFRNNGFTAEGVSQLLRVEKEATGLALINVSTVTGQNQIVICPNATAKFTPETIDFDQALRAPSVSGTKYKNILICQNEVPLATTLLSLKTAHSSPFHFYTVFNTAPAPNAAQVKEIIPYLSYVSLFCPNETEASLITGIQVIDKATAFAACERLHGMGVEDVVITLGKQGYVIASAKSEEGPRHFQATKATAVDTTGAGDCFVGTMAFYLSQGASLGDSCAAANVAAGLSVTKKGTQSSYPSWKELQEALSTQL